MPTSNFSNYLSGHSCRYINYLLGDFKGELKLLSLARAGLDLAGELAHTHQETNDKISHASSLLSDMKIVMNIFNVPRGFPKMHAKYLKVYQQWKHLRGRINEGKTIKNKSLLKFHTNICVAARSSLFVMGSTFFKPLKLAERYCKFGGTVRKISKGWKTISVVKTGLKIGSLSGKLLLGAREPLKLAICLILALGRLLVHVLKLCKISTHYSVPIVLAISKSMFDLYKIYQKTA